MIDDAADAIAAKVISVIRKELKLKSAALLTIPEVAAKYREDRETIRSAAREGRVKCKSVKPRNGKDSFLIDAKDAERVFGAH